MSARQLWAAGFLAFGLTAGALRAGPSVGGDFSLEGALSSGGGTSAGGEFAVEADTGDTATGALGGGDFQVTGGLVGVVVVPGEVALDLTTAGDLVTLMWPASAADYVLEFTPNLGELAVWQPVTPVPAGNTYTTPFNQPLRFFRLRRP